MDLESERSVLFSGEDNREVKTVSVSEKSGKIGESEVQNNGCCEVEDGVKKELTFDVNGKETGVSGSVSSHPMEMKSEVSPSPTTTRKGYGLKKWRRIKRDVSKGGESSVDAGKMVMQETPNPSGNPSKRTQVYAEKQQKSEGSVSSTNAVVGNLDFFSLLGDSGQAIRPLVDAETDSENSEDRSSKSSTAASVPKIKYEIPTVVGFPYDKSRASSLSGKNLIHSVQRGQQGKGRIENIKKARGERVKIEKESSRSSIESDLRSSNFVFVQGVHATSNGIQSDRPVHHDGENGDEVRGNGQQAGDGIQGDCYRDAKGGHVDIPPEYAAADSSSGVKKERSENYGSSSYQDPLVESMFELQSAQEALEKEVLKFKGISKDASVDDSAHPEFTDVEQNVQETSSEKFPSGEGVRSFSQAVQSEVVEVTSRDVEVELEDLFRKRIEAEVVYLAISTTAQKLKDAAADQTTILQERKVPASEQTQTFNKHGDAENISATLKKEENFSKGIASADEMLKLQKRVYKYSWYFFVQLLSLLVILGVFVFQLSPNYVEVVPT